MTLKSLNTGAKLAVTFFLGSVLIATVSALILLGLAISEETEGAVMPSIEGLKLKYAYPRFVSSMKSSMYEYVTEDESIDAVDQWIRDGKTKEAFEAVVRPIMKEDCTKCHSVTSEMTEAMPSMPLSQYKDVLPLTESGYTWTQMSKQAHTHLFGIAVFLVILSGLMAYSTYLPWIRYTLILLSSVSLWMDILGWWLAKFMVDYVYVIYVSGAVMSGSIMAMVGLVCLDLWVAVPWITCRSRVIHGGVVMKPGASWK